MPVVHLGGRSAHQVACAWSFTAAPDGRSARSPALAGENRLVVCVQYSTKTFDENRWAIHDYAPIQGHELVTRRDLIPSEPDHPRVGNWYYALQLGSLEHKLFPVVANRWRRVTFIVTTGDRFRNACKQDQRPLRARKPGRPTIREAEGIGLTVEREWWIDKEGIANVVNLAMPVENGWLPVTFGDRPGPAGGLRFAAEDEPDVCLREIQARLRTFK